MTFKRTADQARYEYFMTGRIDETIQTAEEWYRWRRDYYYNVVLPKEMEEADK